MIIASVALAVALLIGPSAPRRRLARYGLPVPERRRVAMLVGAAAGGLVVALMAPVTATVAAGVIVATLVLRRNGCRNRQRRAKESAALQGALSVLVGELRVGAHPVVAFETAAAEVDGTTAVSLRAVAARARLGADVGAGLRAAAADSTLPNHWERLSTCWELAESQGLAIVALVRAAQRDIGERERFASSVAAGMAGARATAAILAGLPLLGVGLGHLIGADPVSFLLSGGAGGWLLMVGVTLACAGLWWSDRITERVLR